MEKERPINLSVAAQDQAIGTNYFKNKNLKDDIDSKCRLCKEHDDAIDHLTAFFFLWHYNST
jgi:hypothetical protein